MEFNPLGIHMANATEKRRKTTMDWRVLVKALEYSVAAWAVIITIICLLARG